MMMKIFGAALIVSGSCLLGNVRTARLKARLQTIRKIESDFKEFDAQLREYRRSFAEFRSENPELTELTESTLLSAETRAEIVSSVEKMQNASFRESLSVSEELVRFLENETRKTEVDVASIGKALPLVSGAIGLLIAVLLF